MKSGGKFKYNSLELASMTVLALSVCFALVTLSFCRHNDYGYVSADEFENPVDIVDTTEKVKNDTIEKVKDEKSKSKSKSKPKSPVKQKTNIKKESRPKRSSKIKVKSQPKPEPKSPKSRDYRSEIADD